MIEDKIKELESLCNGSIMISINDHKCNYESVEEFFRWDGDDYSTKSYDDQDLKIMVDNDTIYNVHAYPDTPVGFFSYYSSSLQKALDQVINTIKTDRQRC